VIVLGNQRELILIKTGHQFIFRYRPGEEGVMVEALATKADQGDYGFSWLDAAILTTRVLAGEGHAVVDEVS
jgi:hypothetical protein